MNVFHLSARPNRESILKNGLIPTTPKLKTHKQAFESVGIKSNNVIYTWEDCNRNEKFAMDMVYCIVWLHGRNSMKNLPEGFDFSELPNVPIYDYDQMLFDLYVGEISDRHCDFMHEQISVDRDWTSYGMDEKYEHNDKKLHILTTPLIVKPVDILEYSFHKGKVNIKYASNNQ